MKAFILLIDLFEVLDLLDKLGGVPLVRSDLLLNLLGQVTLLFFKLYQHLPLFQDDQFVLPEPFFHSHHPFLFRSNLGRSCALRLDAEVFLDLLFQVVDLLHQFVLIDLHGSDLGIQTRNNLFL